jgi:hypothetical protein
MWYLPVWHIAVLLRRQNGDKIIEICKKKCKKLLLILGYQKLLITFA